MHSPPLIFDLAMILGVAAVVTFIFQKIRQPVVLGYIVAGVIVGPFTPALPTVSDLPSIQVWAELGVVFLMFSLGLEFTFHKLMRVGGPAAGTASVEVLLMLLFGYGTGKLLGWSHLDSLFLGGILSISSTTIIIKAFDELNLKSHRFVEIVFGALIVEDLVAILLLVGLSTVAVTQTLFSAELFFAAAKLVLIVGSWFLVGYFVIPTFVRYAGRSMDNGALTVFSTGLCLILVVIATHFHYSAALGAFIMGSILAETSESHRIESLVTPLKDLFAAVFFVSVGMLVDPKMLVEHFVPIVVVTLVTIFGKIFSTSLGALLTGQPLKRSVQIGFSLAQIGEFSFIIATLGATLKVTSDFLYPVAVTVSVVTTFTTPYLIRYSENFAAYLERVLPASFLSGLAKYSAWVQRTGEGGARRVFRTSQILTFVLNGILVTLVFVAVAEWELPHLTELIHNVSFVQPVAWLSALLFSAPFVWGMLSAFRDSKSVVVREESSSSDIVLFLARLLTALWLGGLSTMLLPLGLTLVATIAFALIGMFFLYRRLDRSYRWFEQRFLHNLQAKANESQEGGLSALAPWDLRLTRLPLHHGSPLSGKAIKDGEIRSRYGLNIVAIQRGDEVLVAPKADDLLYPGDELLVLGTDEQITSFSSALARPERTPAQSRTLMDYSLRRLQVEPDSDCRGKTIRDSGLRESLKALVVGMERGSRRTVNPDPAITLEAGDVLWIVSTDEGT